ncbi:hypothetical protein ET445_07665 [Agromyces protaetiae]|uniref:Uncharacterized protein n=1 Tax=Agromyces protaetiae TaxID=2509455 RepID=A0A4V0YH26_9MICO|nr:hypothetical protein [Agromyces protaetiae]QAY73241.1 hypothetical protein ET445_07665 [Agromyces protaetiae]
MSTIVRAKMLGWAARYLPLEVLGTVAAVTAAWVAYEASGSLAVAAIAGALGESVGYYSVVVARAARGHATSARVRAIIGRDGRDGHGARARRAWATTWLTARSVAAEFGAAEIVDTVVVRPLALWGASMLWGPTPLAWIAGKLAADAVFYTVAIVSLEIGRRVILPDGRADVPARDIAAGSTAERVRKPHFRERAVR